MFKMDFTEICRRLDAADTGSPDLVVGIAEGGSVPASLAAYKTGAQMVMIKISFRNDKHEPEFPAPVLKDVPEVPAGVKTVLLVDDVAMTGKTFETAKKALPGLKIRTLAVKGTADIVLFPEISECVEWPWKAYER